MRRGLLLVPLVAGLAACGGPVAGTPTPVVVGSGAGSPGSGAPSSAVVPGSPAPAREAKCPYLDSTFIADANGQRVGKVRVSADAPTPACFFYRSDGHLQLTAQVYSGDPEVAKALVDRAAPVATANPAELPTGWHGGSQSTDSGAVFAVAKGGSAVVITTNQAQTIKAKRVAEKAIEALGL